MKARMCLMLACALFAAACGKSGTAPEPDPSRPVFSVHSISLAGPTCFQEVSITGSSYASFADYEITNPTVLRRMNNGRSGGVAWSYFTAVGRLPGTSKVIARDDSGAADTLEVRVGNALPTVRLPVDTVRLAVGDSAHLVATSTTPCGLSSFLLLNADTVSSKSVSLSPELFTARNTEMLHLLGHEPRLRLAAVKAGTGRAVLTFWGAADTVVVVVR